MDSESRNDIGQVRLFLANTIYDLGYWHHAIIFDEKAKYEGFKYIYMQKYNIDIRKLYVLEI